MWGCWKRWRGVDSPQRSQAIRQWRHESQCHAWTSLASDSGLPPPKRKRMQGWAACSGRARSLSLQGAGLANVDERQHPGLS